MRSGLNLPVLAILLAAPLLSGQALIAPYSLMEDYQPVVEQVAIDSRKYEPRRTRHQPILVIHETAQSADWVAKRVNAPDYVASFHVFIPRDGRIILMVPPEKTAYTAGRSKFKENPADPQRRRKVDAHDPLAEWDPSGYGTPTVNHFAYQVELESPSDGYWCKEPVGQACVNGGGRGPTHSGYTEAQYKALAWLAVKLEIPRERITTHYQVDVTGKKSDPRSFDWNAFWACLEALPSMARGKSIFLGIEKQLPPPRPVAEGMPPAMAPPPVLQGQGASDTEMPVSD